MGRAACCAKIGLHRGQWTPREDTLLINYIQTHGQGNWKSLPNRAGLLRCGKSCRLRWINYLQPGVKRGNITPDEEELIVHMHSLLGNRWSLIAGRLPGRTDNEIKNYWNTHVRKKLKKQERANERQEGVKVYLPKAVRVRAVSNNNNKKEEHDNEMFIGFEEDELRLLMDTFGGDTINEHVDVNVSDQHRQDLINGSDLECQIDSTIEDVYEEYLQWLEDHSSVNFNRK